MTKVHKKTGAPDTAPMKAEERTGQSSGEAEVGQIPATEIRVEEYEKLQQDMTEASQKCSEYFEGWQRERADFSNYKKRVEREQAQLSAYISAEVMKKYLVILDDLERALKSRPSQGEGASWSEGIELICRKLQNILDAEGITPIPAEGEMFDPALHEAVTHEDSPDHQSGQVIAVLQQGYKIGDRVLRPALVRVAR